MPPVPECDYATARPHASLVIAARWTDVADARREGASSAIIRPLRFKDNGQALVVQGQEAVFDVDEGRKLRLRAARRRWGSPRAALPRCT